MPLGTGVSYNHYCLATPVDPKSSTPMPSYERPIAPRPAPAVIPGEKLVLNQQEKEHLQVFGNAFNQDKENSSESILDVFSRYEDEFLVRTENSFPGITLSHTEDAANYTASLKGNESALSRLNDVSHITRERKMNEYQSPNFCDECQIDDRDKGGHTIDFYDKLQYLKLENRKLLGTLAKFYNNRNDEDSEEDESKLQNPSQVVIDYNQRKGMDASQSNVSGHEYVLDTKNGIDENNLSNLISQNGKRKDSVVSLSESKNVNGDSDNAENSNQILWKRKMEKVFDGIDSDSDTELSPGIQQSSKKRDRVKSAPVKRQKKEFVPTVPEPFGMTIREDQKRREKKLLAEMVDLDVDDTVNTGNENDSRIFKAKGVPKHVNQPIFQNMVIEQPRRYAVGPISRIKRAKSEESINNNFKAKPFPSDIFTDFAYEKMKEDIAYRNIRKEIRQKELLAASNLPPRLKSALAKQSTEIKKEIRKSQDRKPQTRIRGKPVPDFERLYQDFQSNMDANKTSRLTTVLEPFTFDEAVKQWQENRKNLQKRPQSANVNGQIMQDESNVSKSPYSGIKAKVDSKRYSSNPNLSSSVTANVLNSTCNTTSLLRSQKNKERLEKEIKAMEKEDKKKMDAALKQRQLRIMNPAWDAMREKSGSFMGEKRQERLKHEREMQREYQLQLDRIYLKVIKQPTLFQRQSRMNAKQNAEKKYNEVLKKEGLTEDDITKSFEVKKERRLSKSSLSDYSWVSKPCPISSIKSAAKANLGSNTISQIVDAEESCQSLPSEDEFFD